MTTRFLAVLLILETEGGKLRQLLYTLNELQKHPNRRDSLASRYSVASQITDLLNKINQKGGEYDEKF